MRNLFALTLLVLAVGCGKSKSGDDGNVASTSVSTACLYNQSLCSGNNTIYQSGGNAFMMYPNNGYGYGYGSGLPNTGYGYPQQAPYYGDGYAGPRYGQRQYGNNYAGFGYSAGFSAGFGGGYNSGYNGGYGGGYGGGLPINQGGYSNIYNQNIYGQAGVNQMPNLCACGIGSRPVYNGVFGVGCVRNNYFSYVARNAVYYNGGDITNNHYTNFPQYSNINQNQMQNNGCYTNVAWSCAIDQPNSCPTGVCRPLYQSGRLGICTR